MGNLKSIYHVNGWREFENSVTKYVFFVINQVTRPSSPHNISAWIWIWTLCQTEECLTFLYRLRDKLFSPDNFFSKLPFSQQNFFAPDNFFLTGSKLKGIYPPSYYEPITLIQCSVCRLCKWLYHEFALHPKIVLCFCNLRVGGWGRESMLLTK